MAAFRFWESEPGAVPGLSGTLERGAEALPVRLTRGTRLSVRLALLDGASAADGETFTAVSVEAPGGAVRLGPCLFSADPGSGGRSGRLIFPNGLYDCDKLLGEGQVVDLGRAFDNVPLVLSQKEGIRPEFREHVSRVVFDLSVYRRFFDDQERIFAAEPPGVAEVARAALIQSAGPAFFSFLDGAVRELEAIVRDYTKEEHERHGFYLRRQLWPYILSSEFLKRTNLKPSGYAGDAEMMRMLYENRHEGGTAFEQLLHKHPVESDAAQAVRNRRRLVPETLREVVPRFPGLPRHGFRFLSLASGPAWELRDVFLSPADAERFHCSLLDQDVHALAMARQAVASVERGLGAPLAVDYLNDSVRTMLRTRDMGQRFGRYHFIYSMGLFDYLTPPVARAVLAKAYELLEPGGTLFVGNYHVRSATRVYMDYWMDWTLYYRTEESFRALADGLPARNVRITEDATGCQMFLALERPA